MGPASVAGDKCLSLCISSMAAGRGIDEGIFTFVRVAATAHTVLARGSCGIPDQSRLMVVFG